MKSGTHLLYRLLSSHPSILMSVPKEPSYFVAPRQLRDLQPQLWRLGYWRDETRYLRLFQPGDSKPYAGEASVYYTHLPLATGVAAKIKAFNPHSRLIYIMRDPIERTISHYWHRVVYNDEYRPLQQAIEEDRRYRDVSHYAMQLAPYLEAFGPSQLKTLTLEELIGNYSETSKSIFQWLEVDPPCEIPPLAQENVGPTVMKRETRWWSALRSFSRRHELDDLLASAVGSLPAKARNYGAARTGRLVSRNEAATEDVIRFLKPLQRQETRELSALLRRQFPEWRTLNS